MSNLAPQDPKPCPQCGVEFVAGATPLGLCPSCLLKLGASDPSMVIPAAAERVVAPPVVVPATRNPAVARRRRAGWIVAAAIVAALFALSALLRRTPSANLSIGNAMRFELPLPDDTEPIEGSQFAVSPDGTRVVVAARGPDGQSGLWLRALQSTEWRSLANTSGARFPFWSPDSRHVGFFTARSLRRVDVSSGLTQSICDAAPGGGATWGSRGVIVFAAGSAGPLFGVAESGGTPVPKTSLDRARGETAHAWPQFLPDGDSVLFVSSTARETDGGLAIVSGPSGRHRLLVPQAGAGAFAQGYLLVARGSRLLAIRFDPAHAELRDDARPIGGTGSPPFSVSATGVLLHARGEPAEGRLTWFDRAGRILAPVNETGDYQRFSVSPDGSRVAVARRDGPDGVMRIWMMEMERGATVRISDGQSLDSSPVWHPDGRQIAFASRRGGSNDLNVASADGGTSRLLYLSPEPKRPVAWSPDGRLLVYSAESSGTGLDLWTLPLDGDRKPNVLIQGPANESDGRLSPDGRWIAYVSDESGRDEVYLRSFPQGQERWPISSGGGHRPRWRRDGRELFFAEAGRVMSVDVQVGPAPRIGQPVTLFEARFGDDYDVSPDGSRFLVNVPVRDRGRASLQVVLNWASELERR